MSWRYQPVEYLGCFEIIEIYFDSKGKLERWSAIDIYSWSPYGETLKELKRDLKRALKDCKRQPLIKYEDLKVGMKIVND